MPCGARPVPLSHGVLVPPGAIKKTMACGTYHTKLAPPPCSNRRQPAWSGGYLGIFLTLSLEHANLFGCRSKQESESEEEIVERIIEKEIPQRPTQIVERIIEKEILVDKLVEVERGCRGM